MSLPMNRRSALKLMGATAVAAIASPKLASAVGQSQALDIGQLAEDFFSTTGVNESTFPTWEAKYMTLSNEQTIQFNEACAASVLKRFETQEEGLRDRVSVALAYNNARVRRAETKFGRKHSQLSGNQQQEIDTELRHMILPKEAGPKKTGGKPGSGIMKPVEAGCGESRNLAISGLTCCLGSAGGWNWVQCPDWDVWTYHPGYKTRIGSMNPNGTAYLSSLLALGQLQIAGDQSGFTKALIGGTRWNVFFYGSFGQFNISIRCW